MRTGDTDCPELLVFKYSSDWTEDIKCYWLLNMWASHERQWTRTVAVSTHWKAVLCQFSITGFGCLLNIKKNGPVRKRLKSSPDIISRDYYTLIFFPFFFFLHWRRLLTCCMDRVRLLHLHLQLHLKCCYVLVNARVLDRTFSWKQYVFRFLTHVSIKGWLMFLAFLLSMNYLGIWTVDTSILVYWWGNMKHQQSL